ncbi:hypothetical protein E2C01_044355 [Portunus trituberculatus]|jgi:hypothetical protein
MNSG